MATRLPEIKFSSVDEMGKDRSRPESRTSLGLGQPPLGNQGFSRRGFLRAALDHKVENRYCQLRGVRGTWGGRKDVEREVSPQGLEFSDEFDVGQDVGRCVVWGGKRRSLNRTVRNICDVEEALVIQGFSSREPSVMLHIKTALTRYICRLRSRLRGLFIIDSIISSV